MKTKLYIYKISKLVNQKLKQEFKIMTNVYPKDILKP